MPWSLINAPKIKWGERIIDVIADIPDVNDRTQIVGFLRVGFTLRQLDSAITTAISKALAVGAVSLGLGLLGAYVLAHHLSEPVLKLRSSAAKIAAGDLYHRAEIDLADELGALAISFNEMSTSLQASFGRLQSWRLCVIQSRFVCAWWIRLCESKAKKRRSRFMSYSSEGHCFVHDRLPFSPCGRRELRFLFPLLGERARVRAAKDSNPRIILLFSNAQKCAMCNFADLPHPKSLSPKGRGTWIDFGSPSPCLGEGVRG